MPASGISIADATVIPKCLIYRDPDPAPPPGAEPKLEEPATEPAPEPLPIDAGAAPPAS